MNVALIGEEHRVGIKLEFSRRHGNQVLEVRNRYVEWTMFLLHPVTPWTLLISFSPFRIPVIIRTSHWLLRFQTKFHAQTPSHQLPPELYLYKVSSLVFPWPYHHVLTIHVYHLIVFPPASCLSWPCTHHTSFCPDLMLCRRLIKNSFLYDIFMLNIDSDFCHWLLDPILILNSGTLSSRDSSFHTDLYAPSSGQCSSSDYIWTSRLSWHLRILRVPGTHT